jgi:hypothetical protein
MNGQHPVTSLEVFPLVGVGGQRKGKYDDLALSEQGTFLCIV